MPTRELDADQVAAADALRDFVALMQESSLRYRITVDQLTSIDGRLIDAYIFTMDVAGSDFAGTVEVSGAVLEMVTVGDATYQPDRSGAWVRGPRNAAVESVVVNIWDCLGDPTAVQFTSRAAPDLVNLAYRNTRLVAYQTTLMRELGVPGQTEELRLVLTPDGEPTELTCFVQATVPSAEGGPGIMRIALTAKVSDVGAPIKIAAPGS
ncbi:MAG: hypothetical protein A2V85_03395 [Chloroflexi bacterium RBG_16_72_14]|nr:MAG: hypothetical protein A2V85_03395 [Chloroflexi bacterium RBG_16_72_14]